MYKVIIEDEDGHTITEANTNMLFVAYDDKDRGPGCRILGEEIQPLKDIYSFI